MKVIERRYTSSAGDWKSRDVETDKIMESGRRGDWSRSRDEERLGGGIEVEREREAVDNDILHLH